MAGAATAGLIGGVIPGYQPVGSNSFVNMNLEMLYSVARGSVTGYLSGGMESLYSEGLWDNDAATDAAVNGAVGGAVSAGLKNVLMGAAMEKSAEQKQVENRYAEEYGLSVGPYGSVKRSGGMIAEINKLFGYNSGGVTIGRNLLAWGENPGLEKTYIHEGIHYLQQVRYGTLRFYDQTLNDYATYGRNNIYDMDGSMEYEANTWARIKHGQNIPHPGY